MCYSSFDTVKKIGTILHLILTVIHKIVRLTHCFESNQKLIISDKMDVTAIKSGIVLTAISVHYHVIIINSLHKFLNIK